MQDQLSPHSTPIVLTIAGSDCSGGAGIQADIKAISATGSYACSVITAITSQNTRGVNAILPVPVETIESQLDAVFSDLNVIAVKVGMLSDAPVIEAVAKRIADYQPRYCVVDPVMVATSGDRLQSPLAVETLKECLFPVADLITPNLPEAEVLTGECFGEPPSDDQLLALLKLGAQAVLLKGGHRQDSALSRDWLFSAQHRQVFDAPRIITRHTHGTGCTLSSAVASYLAQGERLPEAIKRAKNYITQAIASANELNVGQGRGPVQHFF
ncbi:bifunctional hydroxymethylpyrimidine kinase/phosphomethylpyrimidine kinase [Vibrio sp. AK197]